jgi:hypothetical protein
MLLHEHTNKEQIMVKNQVKADAMLIEIALIKRSIGSALSQGDMDYVCELEEALWKAEDLWEELNQEVEPDLFEILAIK